MPHPNQRTIRSPRFGSNRASGFNTLPLSTTRNFTAPAPPVARAPAPRGLSALRIIPNEEESGRDFGRGRPGESAFGTSSNVASAPAGGASSLSTTPPSAGLQRVALTQPPPRNPDGTRPLADNEKLLGSANGFINAALSVVPGPAGFVGRTLFGAAEKNFGNSQDDARAARETRNAGVVSAPEQSTPGFSIERTVRNDRQREEESSAGGGGDFGRSSSGGDNSFSGRSSSDFGGGDFGFARGGLNKGGARRYADGGLNQPGSGAPAPGGLVEGPGDGNDDGVVVQPADGAGPNSFYSDGEYVLPADVVSALGDGDTESGAAVLDQVIKMIRMQAADKLANTAGPVGADQRQAQQQPALQQPALQQQAAPGTQGPLPGTTPLSASSQHIPTSLGALRSA